MRQPSAAVAAKKARAKAAGKKYKGNASHNLAAINSGTLRHPLFGNRDYWYDTPVKPGFFTRPCQLTAPGIRAGCEIAVARTALAAGFDGP